MKATKFFLMIALVSFALMSFAGNDVDRFTPKVKISIEKAAHNPGLAKAIYEQVDRALLNTDGPGNFTTEVKFKGTVFFVYGTYSQWMDFFTRDMGKIVKQKIDL